MRTLGKEVGVQTLHTGDLDRTPVQTEDVGVQAVPKATPFFPPFSLLEAEGAGEVGEAGDGMSSVFIVSDQSSAEEACADVEIVDCDDSCTAHMQKPDDTGDGVVSKSSASRSKKGSASPAGCSSLNRRGRKPVKELPEVMCMNKASPESIIEILEPILLQHQNHTDPDPFFDSLNRTMIATSSLMTRSSAEEPRQEEGPHEEETRSPCSSGIKVGPKKKARRRGKQRSAAKEATTPQQEHFEEVTEPETVGSSEEALQSNKSAPSSSTQHFQMVPKRDAAPKSVLFRMTEDPSTLLGFLRNVSVVLCRSEVEKGGCPNLRQRHNGCVAGDLQQKHHTSRDDPQQGEEQGKEDTVVEVSCSTESTDSGIDATLLPLKKRKVAQWKDHRYKMKI